MNETRSAERPFQLGKGNERERTLPSLPSASFRGNPGLRGWALLELQNSWGAGWEGDGAAAGTELNVVIYKAHSPRTKISLLPCNCLCLPTLTQQEDDALCEFYPRGIYDIRDQI